VAINITGPCDDQAVLHHEMGLTPSMKSGLKWASAETD